jgi:hypothetical protein
VRNKLAQFDSKVVQGCPHEIQKKPVCSSVLIMFLTLLYSTSFSMLSYISEQVLAGHHHFVTGPSLAREFCTNQYFWPFRVISRASGLVSCDHAHGCNA